MGRSTTQRRRITSH